MATLITLEMTGSDLYKLVRTGETLLCPRCQATIKTVPENWQPGSPLHGIECSVSQKHFLVHWEDASAVREMRNRMDARLRRLKNP